MNIDIHSYGNDWVYPYAADKTGKKIQNHYLYPVYQDLIKEFKHKQIPISTCYELLKYIGDGMVLLFIIIVS